MATGTIKVGTLPISEGGTGATSAASAATNLGVIRGTRSGNYKKIGYIVADDDTSLKRIYVYDNNNTYIGYITYT